MKVLHPWLKSAAMWLIALAAVMFVLNKIDLVMLREHLRDSNPALLILAFLLLNAAQFASAMRMRYFVRSSGPELPPLFAIALYYVGMVYNLVLPGGIGGDGYKVWVLARRYHIKIKTAIGRLLEDRASGLFVLSLLTICIVAAGKAHTLLPHPFYLLPFAAIAAIVGYLVLARLLFGAPARRCVMGSGYSLCVQALNIASALAVIHGMNAQHDIDYLLLFCVSAVLGVLPLSVGGLGVREMVYLTGAPHLGLSAENGVAISLTYFAIYVLTALPGACFIPRMRIKDNSHDHQRA